MCSWASRWTPPEPPVSSSTKWGQWQQWPCRLSLRVERDGYNCKTSTVPIHGEHTINICRACPRETASWSYSLPQERNMDWGLWAENPFWDKAGCKLIKCGGSRQTSEVLSPQAALIVHPRKTDGVPQAAWAMMPRPSCLALKMWGRFFGCCSAALSFLDRESVFAHGTHQGPGVALRGLLTQVLTWSLHTHPHQTPVGSRPAVQVPGLIQAQGLILR